MKTNQQITTANLPTPPPKTYTDNNDLNPRIIAISPKQCYPWQYHNRDKDWLTPKNCQDLIQSIQQNGQIEPIVLRKSPQPNRYEIICGVRRWYACSQIPNQSVMAYTTTADDRACMILMHSENADSKDISDFERAFSFAEQMASGVFKNQTEMSKAMGVAQGTISKMIQSTEIFNYPWIKQLFKNKIGIPIKLAYTLSTLLKKEELRSTLKSKAEKIASEMKEKNLTTKQILKTLTTLETSQKVICNPETLLAINNQSIISKQQDHQQNFTLVIDNEAKKMNKPYIEKLCIEAIRHFLNENIPEEYVI